MMYMVNPFMLKCLINNNLIMAIILTMLPRTNVWSNKSLPTPTTSHRWPHLRNFYPKLKFPWVPKWAL